MGCPQGDAGRQEPGQAVGWKKSREKLKQKLNAEGLFAPERKRPLPRYPQRIGLVTSPTGAAIRDVLHVVERRNPALDPALFRFEPPPGADVIGRAGP